MMMSLCSSSSLSSSILALELELESAEIEMDIISDSFESMYASLHSA